MEASGQYDPNGHTVSSVERAGQKDPPVLQMASLEGFAQYDPATHPASAVDLAGQCEPD